VNRVIRVINVSEDRWWPVRLGLVLSPLIFLTYLVGRIVFYGAGRIRISVLKDLIVHWTDIGTLIEILNSGEINEGTAFSDNPWFGLHSPEKWYIGLVFRKKDLPKLIPLEWIVIHKDEILKGDYPEWMKDVAEIEPDVPYWGWEHEFRCTKPVDISLLHKVVTWGVSKKVREKLKEWLLENYIINVDVDDGSTLFNEESIDVYVPGIAFPRELLLTRFYELQTHHDNDDEILYNIT